MPFFIKSGNEGSSLKTVLIFRIVLAVFIIGITLTLFSLGVSLWQARALMQSMLKTNADNIKEKVDFKSIRLKNSIKDIIKIIQKEVFESSKLFDFYLTKNDDKVKMNIV